MYFVYIIESLSSGNWYYGYSSNLNPDWMVIINKSTAGRGPWKFIFVRELETKREALSFEIYLKKLRKKDYIKSKFFLIATSVYLKAKGHTIRVLFTKIPA